MISYQRSFYQQSDQFHAHFDVTAGQDAMEEFKFGLSGTSQLNFVARSGVVKANGKICSSLNKEDNCFYDIYGWGGIVSIWENGRPIACPLSGGFNFSSVYSFYPNDAIFSERVFGVQPIISGGVQIFEPQKSGNFVLYNSGQYPLFINSVIHEGFPLNISGSGFSIPSSGSGQLPFHYNTNSPFSGTGILYLNTNAGEIIVSGYGSASYTNPYVDILVEIQDNTFDYPSGFSPFFIYNESQNESEVEIFLDFVSKQSPPSGEPESNFSGFWNVRYQDVDRGLENFSGLSRRYPSGLGVTGVKYRIPANSTTSGFIDYSSPRAYPLFQGMNLRVTNFSSINHSLYVSSETGIY